MMDKIDHGQQVAHRSRLPWRRWFQERWLNWRWLIVGALWLLAFGLGYAGFSDYFARLGESRSSLDILYLTLQLFTLESGALSGPRGWALEVARLLAPAVAAYTAFQALSIILDEQLDRVRLRRFRDHVVICGLGRKGYLLAQAFRRRGDAVVVIELDEDNPYIAPCKEHGVIVLIGDAMDDAMLHQAGVPRAGYLISACGADGDSADIAVRAAAMVKDQSTRVLTCILHIVDPQLCTLLREREIAGNQSERFRVSFFNVFDSGARTLLREHPPFDRPAGVPAHILVVGLGQMGENLVVQIAREWYLQRPDAGERLRLTIVDCEAERKTESLFLRYPQLEKSCDLVAHSMDVRWPDFQRADFLFNAAGDCDVSIAYVCFDDDSLGLSAALVLRQRTRQVSMPIVVRMEQEAGLGMLLGEMDDGDDEFENLRAFGLLDRTCTPEWVLGGTREMIARAIHQDYLRRHAADPSFADPARAPWERLSPQYQESCRRQAGHLGHKLKAVGCGVAPLTDWDAERFEFTAGEIERMARLEHQRWMDDRLRDGWTLGPRRPEKKTNPHLVSWEQLPEEVKDLNRDMMRGLPTFLARAGLQIYRLTGV
ncbi:MAG: NAD-binding protein [Anaerolineae bacterium]|nr:NAD-binding protein [Anaerolineae bacterium]